MTEQKATYTLEQIFGMTVSELFSLAAEEGLVPGNLPLPGGTDLREDEGGSANVATSQQTADPITVDDYYRQLSVGGQWVPSRQAIASAMAVVKYIRIDLTTMKYRTWCAEKKRSCNNAEWLRWITRDEEDATKIVDKENAEKRRKRDWSAVAD